MAPSDLVDSRVENWLTALEQRHMADLRPAEVARALRALSSCYVERRTRLADGGALGSTGKRAAFALFYAPVHFLVTRYVVRSLAFADPRLTHVLDLGCGTGSAGAAWALEADGIRLTGVDRHPWAVAEAHWTYRQLLVQGHALQGDLARTRIAAGEGSGILLAYAVNELPELIRKSLLERLLSAASRGAQVLVIEPIARRLTPWWSEWEAAVTTAGGESRIWRIETPLPRRQSDLARAAGLKPRELTARSLSLTGAARASSTSIPAPK